MFAIACHPFSSERISAEQDPCRLAPSLRQATDISTVQTAKAHLFDRHDVCSLLIQGFVDLRNIQGQ